MCVALFSFNVLYFLRKDCKFIRIVCQIIAPNAGDELLQSCIQLSYLETGCASGDLVAPTQAYKNAPTRNLKTEILTLYAYRVIQ